MNSGDFVTGKPASPVMAGDYPRVTGTLEITPVEFMGDSWNVYTVHAKYENGSDCPVEVDGESIVPASPRRSPVTVVELP